MDEVKLRFATYEPTDVCVYEISMIRCWNFIL